MKLDVHRIFSNPWKDYELIDAGGGKKLERWGSIITIRPEIQAYFKSGIPFTEWDSVAHWEFVSKGTNSGYWKNLKGRETPSSWDIQYEKLTIELSLTKFKHLGLFPEQQTNWEFIREHINPMARFLNVFAYTGAASCIARFKGAETIHVDSVKQAISWAKTNMEKSNLLNIKWVLEDAMKFLVREKKRGNHYQGIIMDPPAWGLGTKGERWKIEDKIDELLQTASSLLGANGFLIMNTYSPAIEISLIESLADLYFPNRKSEIGELWMKSSSGKELYFGNILRIC